MKKNKRFYQIRILTFLLVTFILSADVLPPLMVFASPVSEDNNIVSEEVTEEVLPEPFEKEEPVEDVGETVDTTESSDSNEIISPVTLKIHDGNEEHTVNRNQTGAGWEFVVTENEQKLILNGFNGQSIYADGDITIILTGDNTLTLPVNVSSFDTAVKSDGKLNIQDDGIGEDDSLTIKVESKNDSDKSDPIRVLIYGTEIELNGGNYIFEGASNAETYVFRQGGRCKTFINNDTSIMCELTSELLFYRGLHLYINTTGDICVSELNQEDIKYLSDGITKNGTGDLTLLTNGNIFDSASFNFANETEGIIHFKGKKIKIDNNSYRYQWELYKNFDKNNELINETVKQFLWEGNNSIGLCTTPDKAIEEIYMVKNATEEVQFMDNECFDLINLVQNNSYSGIAFKNAIVGGNGNVNFSIDPLKPLPAGLKINSGKISGIPTELTPKGEATVICSYTVTENGQKITKTKSIDIEYEAVQPDPNKMIVGESTFAYSNASNGEGWSYEYTNNKAVLTLNGYNGGPIYSPKELTVILDGENTITIPRGGEFGISVGSGKLYVEEENKDSQNLLNIRTAEPIEVMCCIIKNHTVYSDVNYVYLNGGSVSIEVESNDVLTVFGGRTVVNGNADLSVDVKSIRNNNVIGFSNGLVFGEDKENGNGTVSLKASSPVKGSFLASDIVKNGSGTLSIEIPATDTYTIKDNFENDQDIELDNAVKVVSKELTVSDSAGGKIVVNGFLHDVKISKADWNIMNVDKFIWNYPIKLDTDSKVYNFITDENGNPLTMFTLIKEENQPLSFMDNALFDIPEGEYRIGDTMYSPANWIEGVRGGNGTYTFSLAQQNSLPEGLSVDSDNGNLTGKVTKACNAGTFIVQVTSGDESAEIEIAYPAVKANVAIDKISFNKDYIIISQNKVVDFSELMATINPADADSLDVEWEFDKEYIFLETNEADNESNIKHIKVTAKDKAGKTTVKVTTALQGLTALLDIYIKEKTPDNISISNELTYLSGFENDKKYNIRVGENEYFISPADFEFVNGKTSYYISEEWYGEEISISVVHEKYEQCNSNELSLFIPNQSIPNELFLTFPVPELVGDNLFTNNDVDVISSEQSVASVFFDSIIVDWEKYNNVANVSGKYNATIVLQVKDKYTIPENFTISSTYRNVTVGTVTVSDNKAVKVSLTISVKEKTPFAKISEDKRYILGLEESGKYQINNEIYDTVSIGSDCGIVIDWNWAGQTLNIVRVSETEGCNSDAQELMIPSDLLPTELILSLPEVSRGSRPFGDKDVKVYDKENNLIGAPWIVCEESYEDGLKGVNWFPALSTETFQAAGEYTATIVLKAMGGLTFPTSLSNSFGYSVSRDGKFLTIKNDYYIKEEIPNAKINKELKSIVGLEYRGSYIISGAGVNEKNSYVANYIEGTEEIGLAIEREWIGKEISIIKVYPGNSNCNSEPQKLVIDTDLIANKISLDIPAAKIDQSLATASDIKIKEFTTASEILDVFCAEILWEPDVSVVSEGNQYKAKIILEAIAPLTFPEEVSVFVNGSKEAATVSLSEDKKTLIVSDVFVVKDKTPVAEVSDDKEYLVNLLEGVTYIIENEEYIAYAIPGTDTYGVAIDLSWAGQQISIIRKNAVAACNSEAQLLTIPTDLIANNIEVSFDLPVLNGTLANLDSVTVNDADRNVSIKDIETNCKIEWSEYLNKVTAGSYNVTITLTATGNLTFPANVNVTLNDSPNAKVVVSDKVITITNQYYVKNAKPQAFISDDKDYLVNLIDGETYIINEKEYVAKEITGTNQYGILIDFTWAGKEISIVHKHEIDACSGDAQLLIIPTDLIAENINVSFSEPVLGDIFATADDVIVTDTDKDINIKGTETDCKVKWSSSSENIDAGLYEVTITLTPVGNLSFPENVNVTLNKSTNTDEIIISAKEITIKNSYFVRNATPEATVSSDKEYIVNLIKDEIYLINGEEFVAKEIPGTNQYGVAIDLSWAGTEINIIRKHLFVECNSFAQKLSIPTDLIAEKITITFAAPEWDSLLASTDSVLVFDANKNSSINNIELLANMKWSVSEKIVNEAGVYTATITLNAKDNLIFPANVKVSVNNEELIVIKNSNTSITVEKVFYVVEKTPTAYLSEDSTYILGLHKDGTYLISGTVYKTEYVEIYDDYGVSVNPKWSEKKISIIKVNVDSKCNSPAQMLQMPYIAEPVAPDYIPELIEVGIDNPEYGKKLTNKESVNLFVDGVENENLSCASVVWLPSVSGDVVQAGKYTATITLVAGDGMSFDNNMICRLNGEQKSVNVSEDGKIIIINHTFILSEKTPNAKVTDDKKYISGLLKDSKYLINGSEYQTVEIGNSESYGVSIDLNWAGTEVTIIKVNPVAECNSSAQKLFIPSDLIDDTIFVSIPEVKMGEKLATDSDVIIKANNSEIKGTITACSVSWNPNVVRVEKGGRYTATITLNALKKLTFKSNTNVFLNGKKVEGILSENASTLTLSYSCDIKENMPEIYVLNQKYLAGFEKDAEYTIDGVKYVGDAIEDTDTYGIVLPLEWAGKTLEIVKLNAISGCNSEVQKLEIPTDLITKNILIEFPVPEMDEKLATEQDVIVKAVETDEVLDQLVLDKAIAWNTTEDRVTKGGLYKVELKLTALYALTFTKDITIVVNDKTAQFEISDDYKSVTVVLDYYVKEKTTNVKLSDDLCYIVGFEDDAAYLVNNREMIPVWNADLKSFVVSVNPEWAGKSISVVKTNTYQECYSDEQLLEIPKELISERIQIEMPALAIGNKLPEAKDISVTDLKTSMKINDIFVESNLVWENENNTVLAGNVFKGSLVLTAKGNISFAENTAVTGIEYIDYTIADDLNSITITFEFVVKELKPEAYVTEDAQFIAGLMEGATYLVNGESYTTVSVADEFGIAIEAEWRGTTISIIKDNTVELCRSEALDLFIPMLKIDKDLVVLLPKPVYGEKPVTNKEVLIKSGDTLLTEDKLSVIELTWLPLIEETFGKSVDYTAQLTLKASQGYIFAEDTSYLTEGIETTYTYSEDKTSVVLTIRFSTTSGEGFWVEEIPEYVYTGRAIKPEVKVYYNDELLTKKDYSIAYTNNINAAAYNAVNEKGKSIAPTITITGKGRFIGKFVKTFTIKPLDLNEYVTNEEMQDILSIEPVYARYTGKFIKTEPIVKLNGEKIAKNKQFRFEYSDSSEGAYIQNGVYEIKIVGLEKNMTGSTTTTMTISNKKIDKVSVSLDKKFIPYNKETGYTTPGKIVIKDGNKLLTEGVDYEISYLNHDKVGVANLVITGIGTYCGVKKVVYHILGTELKSENLKVLVKSRPYNMKAQSVTDGVDYYVKCNGEILKEGVDFTLEYTGNRVKQGNMPVKFKGINAYKGTFTYNFKISKIDVNKLDISLKNSDTVYFSKGQTKPLPEVYFNGVLLTLNVDYKIVYKNYTVVRTANEKNAPQFHINGIGNFTGSTRENPYKFSIVRAPISECADISVYNVVYKNTKNNYVPKYKMFDKTNRNTLYRNADIDPNFIYEIWDESLEEFVPFTEKRVDASEHPVKMRVTFTGIKNYCGTASYEYFVCPKNIAATSIKVDKIPSVEYNGEAHTPIPVIRMKVKNGKKTEYIILDESNYTLEYSDNVNRGTATIKIVGRGEFAGERKVKFVIARRRISNN